MESERNWLAEELAKDCRIAEDIQEKLKHLCKETIQQVSEAEFDTHLGYQIHDHQGGMQETDAILHVKPFYIVSPNCQLHNYLYSLQLLQQGEIS